LISRNSPPLSRAGRAPQGRCSTSGSVALSRKSSLAIVWLRRSRDATLAPMADIPARDLRNDVSAVLRRVERGESLRVTVSGRPVAELVPLPSRPRSVTWDTFLRDSDRWRADPEFAQELANLLPDTTDDVPIR
jgi:prevent-host-death family protein